MPLRCQRLELDNSLILAICIMIVAYSFMRSIAIFYTNKHAEYGSFILARDLWFIDIRLVDTIVSHFVLSVLNLKDIVKTNCYWSQFNQFVHPCSFAYVRIILNRISNTQPRWCVLRLISQLKMQEHEQQGRTIILSHIKICGQ